MAGVILDALYADALIDQALAEGLVTAKSPGNDSHTIEKLVPRALQSILLFGPALIFRDEDRLCVPGKSLQELPFIEIAPQAPNSFPIYEGSQKATEEEVEDFLQEARYLRPFIAPWLYRLLKGYLESNTILDKAFGLSFEKLRPQRLRRIVEQLPEIALLCVVGSERQWESIEERGYHEQAFSLVDGGRLIDESLLPTILVAANEPKKLLTESRMRHAPVLSEMLECPSRSVPHRFQEAESLLSVVRLSLSEVGYELPRLTTISQLLELEGDDRVLSLRHAIREFTSELSQGSVDAALRLQRQADEASRALKDLTRWRKRTQWTFLVPLAVGLAEALSGLFPSVSIAATLGLAGGEYAIRQKEKKYQWTGLLSRRATASRP